MPHVYVLSFLLIAVCEKKSIRSFCDMEIDLDRTVYRDVHMHLLIRFSPADINQLCTCSIGYDCGTRVIISWQLDCFIEMKLNTTYCYCTSEASAVLFRTNYCNNTSGSTRDSRTNNDPLPMPSCRGAEVPDWPAGGLRPYLVWILPCVHRLARPVRRNDTFTCTLYPSLFAQVLVS